MSYPTDRDALARHLYIHAHDDEGATQRWRDAGAQEWDAGKVTPDDLAAFYEQADRMIDQGVSGERLR